MGKGLEYNKEGIKERNEKIIKLIHIKYILKAKDR